MIVAVIDLERGIRATDARRGGVGERGREGGRGGGSQGARECVRK